MLKSGSPSGVEHLTGFGGGMVGAGPYLVMHSTCLVHSRRNINKDESPEIGKVQ